MSSSLLFAIVALPLEQLGLGKLGQAKAFVIQLWIVALGIVLFLVSSTYGVLRSYLADVEYCTENQTSYEATADRAMWKKCGRWKEHTVIAQAKVWGHVSW